MYSVNGPNYQALRAQVGVTQGVHRVGALYPEYRTYGASHTALSKTDIAINWRRDLYVALGSEYKDHSWSVRIYEKPFVRWIWAGGLMMVLGGVLAAVL